MEGKHLLRELIPATQVVNDDASSYTYEFGVGQGGGGWEIVNNGTTRAMLVWRGSFDLGGYALDDLTTFVLGVDFQEANTHLASNLEATGAIHNWRMLTTREVGDDDFSAGNFTTALTMFNPPGMIASNMDLGDVFSGKYRQLTPDTTANNLLVQTNAQSWGVGDATAANRIHITFAYLLSGNLQAPAASYLVVPPQAIAVPIFVTEEPDLVYIERLRRSYILATTVD